MTGDENKKKGQTIHVVQGLINTIARIPNPWFICSRAMRALDGMFY